MGHRGPFSRLPAILGSKRTWELAELHLCGGQRRQAGEPGRAEPGHGAPAGGRGLRTRRETVPACSVAASGFGRLPSLSFLRQLSSGEVCFL